MSVVLPQTDKQYSICGQNLTDIPLYVPKHIHILDARNNNLQIINTSRLPTFIKELYISKNKLLSLPEDLPSTLLVLDFSYNYVTKLPDNLPLNLQKLILVHNNLQKLEQKLPHSITDLILSQNHLAKVPENLPPFLRRLEISGSNLPALPENLPHTLEFLDVSQNDISNLPENLPPKLRILDASQNVISELPKCLPSTLVRFDISLNCLTHFPENLPNGLQVLKIMRNELDQLPDKFPNFLKTLNISRNNIRMLPETLPSSIERLDCSNNELRSLPLRLPESLKELRATHNSIIEFPQNLPRDLHILDLTFNQITRLSPCVENMSPLGVIYIECNELTQETMDTITRLTYESNTRMPRIYFSRAMPQNASVPIKPLQEEIRNWLQDIDERWIVIGKEPGAGKFSHFLSRLRQTVNFQNEQFKEDVKKLLRDLINQNATNTDLRERIFLIAEEATQTCEDRVSWSLNQMKTLKFVTDVENGIYDNNLSELIEIARGMFRLSVLEKIARKKVSSLNFVDEIEVYLAYEVKLKEKLKLPVPAPDMRFYNVNWVSEKDLQEAVTEVMAEENKEFLEYLAIDWQPWKEVLKRCRTKEYDEANERLQDESYFHQKLDQRKIQYMKDTKLSKIDNNTEVLLGNQIQRNIKKEVWCPLTIRFLRSHKLQLF